MAGVVNCMMKIICTPDGTFVATCNCLTVGNGRCQWTGVHSSSMGEAYAFACKHTAEHGTVVVEMLLETAAKETAKEAAKDVVGPVDWTTLDMDLRKGLKIGEIQKWCHERVVMKEEWEQHCKDLSALLVPVICDGQTTFVLLDSIQTAAMPHLVVKIMTGKIGSKTLHASECPRDGCGWLSEPADLLAGAASWLVAHLTVNHKDQVRSEMVEKAMKQLLGETSFILPQSKPSPASTSLPFKPQPKQKDDSEWIEM